LRTRFDTSEKFSDQDRNAILDLARRALARLQPSVAVNKQT
jgi:hypothetical protein